MPWGFTDRREALIAKQVVRERKDIPSRSYDVPSVDILPSAKPKGYLAQVIGTAIEPSTTTALSTGNVRLLKRDKATSPFLDIIHVQHNAEDVEKTVYNPSTTSRYQSGNLVWVMPDTYGDFFILPVGVGILTVKLNVALASGGTQTASVYDDTGTTDTGIDVNVKDSPVFIPASKTIPINTFLRVYLGDDGDYRMLATSTCAV